MRVEVVPGRIEAVPGLEQVFQITITNPGTVIGGYTVRVLGLDPSWVSLDDDQVSLFPDETRTILATVTLPDGLAAGERRGGIQVRELTPPFASAVAEVVIAVPEAPAQRVAVDPVSLTVGRSGTFSLLVDNTGNTQLRGRLVADDAEAQLKFLFTPERIDLAPGQHAVVDMRVSGRRPLTGAPLVRMIGVHLDDRDVVVPVDGGLDDLDDLDDVHKSDGAKQPAAAAPTPRGRRPGRRAPALAPAPPATPPLANATLLQKAWFGRGAFSMLGLLVAVTVFAVVITVALSSIVGRSAADRDLALEIAAAQDAAANGGGAAGTASGLRGTVRDLSTGSAIEGVVVSVFAADDPTRPLRSLATGPEGAYAVGGLPAGDYKLSYRGADYVQQWFPAALEPDNAETVTLEENNLVAGLDVALGGVPAEISGKVLGDDVTNASITLRTPAASSTTTPDGLAADAVVQTAPVGAGGEFVLGGLPSPAVYDVVVSKEGYADAVQRVDVGPGETRRGVEINLVKGNGSISGRVVLDGKPKGEVLLTATAGDTTATTISLTDGRERGSFTLSQLPTPASYTIVASVDGAASQTLLVALQDAQQVTDLTFTLTASSGSLSGSAIGVDGEPLGGVTVTVSDGSTTVQTATRSAGKGDGDIGSWTVDGLPLPGTYTVTLARDDLVSQTVSTTLDASGVAVEGAALSQVVMRPSTASIVGVVSQGVREGQRCTPEYTAGPVGEVTVSVTSGTQTYTVTTATVPDDRIGQFRIDGIKPGTYTVGLAKPGVTPTSEIVTLAAGDVLPFDRKLKAPTSISGVVRQGEEPVGPGYVVELYRAGSYPQTVYATTRTEDAAGTYKFCDIDAPETYIVQVRRTPGGAPLGTTNVRVNPSDAPDSVNVRVRRD